MKVVHGTCFLVFYNVWADLKEQIEVSRAELDQLFDFHRELFEEADRDELSGIELSASATFFTLSTTASRTSSAGLRSSSMATCRRDRTWHQRLLRSMTQPVGNRPAVISENLLGRLKEYLDFRHLFRGIYPFQLRWDRMEHLVYGAGGTYSALQLELETFIERIDQMIAE